MNKTEYMNTLRQELEGLPGAIIEEALWHYEGLFVNGMMEGKTEEDIANSLPKPSIVAAQRRAKLRADTVKRDLHPGNLARLLVALVAVLFFNLLMVIPAIIYSTLLFAAYISGLSIYFAGILVTAASLAGVPQMTFYIPHGQHHVHIDDHHHRRYGHGDVTVDIGGSGIHIKKNNSSDGDEATVDVHIDRVKTPDSPAVPAVPAPPTAPAATPAAPTASTTASVASQPNANVTGKASSAEHDGIPVVIGHHLGLLDAVRGVGLILGGIALFLFALFMTKMTFVGFKQYVNWNMSLLHLSDKK